MQLEIVHLLLEVLAVGYPVSRLLLREPSNHKGLSQREQPLYSIKAFQVMVIKCNAMRLQTLTFVTVYEGNFRLLIDADFKNCI